MGLFFPPQELCDPVLGGTFGVCSTIHETIQVKN